MSTLGELVHVYGMVGLFLFAFISNAIPYSTIPYLIIIAPIMARYKDLDLTVAIVSLALGATLGKLIIYLIGRGIASISRIQRAFSGLRNLTTAYSGATFLVVFLAAASPIPDDVFYIPVGLSKYNLILFFIAVLLGKTIITALTALYGVAFRFLFEELVGLPQTIYIPLMVIATLILVVIGNSIDWEGVSVVYRERGFIEALEYMVRSIPTGIKKSFRQAGFRNNRRV